MESLELISGARVLKRRVTAQLSWALECFGFIFAGLSYPTGIKSSTLSV